MSELLEDELFETIEELRDQIHNLTMDLRHAQAVNDDLNREIMEYQKGLDAERDEYVEEIKKQEEKNKSVFVDLDRAVMANQALEVQLANVKSRISKH